MLSALLILFWVLLLPVSVCVERCRIYVVKAQSLIANLINKTLQKQKSTQTTTNSDTNRNKRDQRYSTSLTPSISQS